TVILNTLLKKHRKLILADCENRGLNFIPQNLPGDINVLDLSSNQLTAIYNNSFVNYKYLQELILGKNQIEYLSSGSFKGLYNLDTLDMSHNMLDLSKTYSAEIFVPIKNLTKLDIRSNMPQPIDFEKEFIYPDHVFEVLSELSFLGIDMMPVPQFRSGFSQMTNLHELHFKSCYLVSLSNTTFQAFSYFVQELSLINCRLKAVRTDVDVLLPFPNLRIIDFHGTFMHLRRALYLLHPYMYSNLTTINFGHVSDASIDSSELPFVTTLTADMMKYLKTICVENLDLSNNGIVDYEPGSLFTFDRPECLQTLSLNRNRFVIVTTKTISDFNSFCGKSVQLKSIDYSYNAVNYFIDNSVNSILEKERHHGSFVTLPKSLEKLDMRNTLLTTYPAIWFKVPLNNNLKYLDISYSRTNMPLVFLEIRIETFINLLVFTKLRGVN
ncbi:decorin, partial [Mytilus galloprovincialis]